MAFRSGRGKYVVRLDFYSIGLILIAAFIFVFTGLAPGSQALGTFLGMFLALMLVMMIVINREVPFDPGIDKAESRQMAKWFLACLVVILGASAFVSTFPNQLAQAFGAIGLVTVGSVSSAAIIILIPNPEEVGFRGVLAPYLGNSFGIYGGSVAGGVLFMVYHFFVYGDQPGALVFVAIVGFFFTYAALRTARLAITLAAHEVNNFASLGFPGAHAYLPNTIPDPNAPLFVLLHHLAPYSISIFHALAVIL